jgi:hypothetical protein
VNPEWPKTNLLYGSYTYSNVPPLCVEVSEEAKAWLAAMFGAPVGEPPTDFKPPAEYPDPTPQARDRVEDWLGEGM